MTTPIQHEPEHNAINTQRDPQRADELRRQMYERIARGHALAEAEDNARRQSRGR